MFRFMIIAILILIIFVGAYNALNHLFKSRNMRRIHVQHRPNEKWKSIYPAIGLMLSIFFSGTSAYLIHINDYSMALVSGLFIIISIWIIRKC